MAGLLALYVVLSALFGFVQTKLDDMQYGRPRTTHLDAYVGHAGEQAGAPSHFIAMNLDRRVVLIELPGGDTQNATTITGALSVRRRRGSDADQAGVGRRERRRRRPTCWSP